MLDRMFPEAEGIFSVKPMTGHCQAASSAVEIAAACLAFETGVIPRARAGRARPSAPAARDQPPRSPESC